MTGAKSFLLTAAHILHQHEPSGDVSQRANITIIPSTEKSSRSESDRFHLRKRNACIKQSGHPEHSAQRLDPSSSKIICHSISFCFSSTFLLLNPHTPANRAVEELSKTPTNNPTEMKRERDDPKVTQGWEQPGMFSEACSF